MMEHQTYMIAYLTMKGWMLADPPHNVWRHSSLERESFNLSAAYDRQREMDKDTIPSPPNPEIELYALLQDLCVWYEDEAEDMSPRLKAGLPHDLFEQIANYIGYEMKG
jgi:hypothetical protein